jgi:hypothetical protein
MSKIKNVAVQMDHVSSIKIGGDSTFAMSLEAQARGYKLFHYTPDQLSMRDGVVQAIAEPMILRDVEGDHFELGPQEKIDLSSMDVVLLRQDPPFDMSYITSTHLLERVHPKTLVVNDPAWVRNSPEKIFRHRVPRPDAEDADFPRSGDDQRLPRGSRRHDPQAALRQWRRRRVPRQARRPQHVLASGNVRADVPRAVHRAGIPVRCAPATSASS